MITPEEKHLIADYLMKHNLEKANSVSEPVKPNNNTFYVRYVKRIADIIVSLIAIIITFPINIILGICTYFDVGRPIFFKQERPGKNGELFTLVKFRNMKNAVDEKGYWLPLDQRVTKFGGFVRKTSLDELLNFYSILKGDMSLIGPRPLAEIYMDRYSNRHKMRHSVRPGLECPNISCRGYSSGWQAQLENDIWYVENVNFKTDCRMVFFLIRMVLDFRVRKQHAVEGLGDFLGYDENGIAFGARGIPQEYLDILDELKKESNEK